MNNVSTKHESATEGKAQKGFGKLMGNEEMDAASETRRRASKESGAVGWVLLWLLGIPLPILLIVYLILR